MMRRKRVPSSWRTWHRNGEGSARIWLECCSVKMRRLGKKAETFIDIAVIGNLRSIGFSKMSNELDFWYGSL